MSDPGELVALRASHALQVAEVTKMAGLGADLAQALALLREYVVGREEATACEWPKGSGTPCTNCRTLAFLRDLDSRGRGRDGT